MLLGLHHVCLIVSNYQEAIHLYVDLLGFRLYRQSYSQSKKRKKLELFLNGVYVLEIFVYDDTVENIQHIQMSGIDHLSFLTADVEKVRNYLSINGVKVSPVLVDEQSERKYFFFYNSDGTKHELFSAGDDAE
jgi:glyoxylase I family protein